MRRLDPILCFISMGLKFRHCFQKRRLALRQYSRYRDTPLMSQTQAVITSSDR